MIIRRMMTSECYTNSRHVEKKIVKPVQAPLYIKLVTSIPVYIQASYRILAGRNHFRHSLNAVEFA